MIFRTEAGWRAGAWFLALAFAFTGVGCSSTGGSFNLFPQSHNMIEATKEVRRITPAPIARELEKQPMATYVIEPGDGLLVLPAELDSPVRLPSDQTVLADGTIDLGRYGRPQVAGMTVAEIEAVVNRAVAAGTKAEKPKEGEKPRDIAMTVRLVNRVSKVYYVLGEVNSPGSFPLQGRETVLDGIIAAGGLNSKSSRKNVVLVRPTLPDDCRQVLAVCLPEIVQLGDTSTNYQLRPGDRIYVATSGFWESMCSSFGKQSCVTCTGPQRACPPDGFCGPPTPMDPHAIIVPAAAELRMPHPASKPNSWQP